MKSGHLMTGSPTASPAKCRVCGSPAIFQFKVRNEELWRCQACGFLQVGHEPDPKTLDAIYSQSYFTSSKYKDDPVALSRENSRRLKMLSKWATANAEVLDAGCSTGDFVAYAKNSFRMYGNDYSSFAIELAQQRNPDLVDRLTAGRLEDGLWSDRQFDAICLWDVIEHIWDPVRALRDLLVHVRPGGAILLSTPAADSAMARALGAYWPFMTPPEHLSFFSMDAFRAAAKAIGGCEVVSFSRRGKWANMAFIAYKMSRIAPQWFPSSLLRPFQMWPLKKLSVYVPTGDILYVVMRRIPAARTDSSEAS